MEVKDILRKTDRQIAYLENKELYIKNSIIDDMDSFIKEISSINNTTDFEEGIIWMSIKEPKEEYDIRFLEKYNQYLNKALEIDPRNYFNNRYCNYLLSNSWNSLENNNKTFINGKNLEQLSNILFVNKYNYIMEKIDNGEDIDNKDKQFIEELFLFMAYNDSIIREIDGEPSLMSDIKDYFKKYPISDLNSPRNRQLYLLYILSSRMLEFNCNSAIQFYEDSITNSNKNQVLGSFYKTEDGIAFIRINNVDIYNMKTDKEFLEKIFTIFHELGHFRQNNMPEQYENNQEIIDMEKEIMKNNRQFYNKYHDSFFIERDADNYAIEEMMNEFWDKYPEIVSSIINKELRRKRIPPSKFIVMEIEEYDKLGKTSINKFKNKT